MGTYIATYEHNGEVISEAQLSAKNIKEAQIFAQQHKRHTPEISKYRYVTTRVRRLK